MIMMMLVLLVLALLVARQWGGVAGPGARVPGAGTEQPASQVPRHVQDLPAFEREMRRIMDDAARDRMEAAGQ
ncbi:hypothetical protein [Thioalkalivibrio paradoxus]|uniref:hypothetical protein n=1 Tax=Thioalkalivibrio paradoxus TaxID=108010 RepID=UPI000318CC70|nr:hypothetical protein [Thioalkalivibrio paradoxus]